MKSCPDAVIIPGTKSTIADLETLMASGLAKKIKDYYHKGGIVFGICGGYQVMGKSITDPMGIDIKGGKEVNGLDLLPVETAFLPKKQVRLTRGTYLHNIFHNDSFRNQWLNQVRAKKGFPVQETVDTSEIKERSYEKLAEVVCESLDMDYIMTLINKDDKSKLD